MIETIHELERFSASGKVDSEAYAIPVKSNQNRSAREYFGGGKRYSHAVMRYGRLNAGDVFIKATVRDHCLKFMKAAFPERVKIMLRSMDRKQRFVQG